MKLAVVAPSPVPFTIGGAERAWTGIVRAVNEQTSHACELLKLPSPERDLAEVARSYRAFLSLDVTHFDRVLTSKYPAWMVDHPEHDIYLFHRLRGLYDTYPAHLPPRGDVRDREVAEVLRIVRGHPSRARATEVCDLVERLCTARPDDPVLGHPGPVGREVVHWLDGIGFEPDPARRYFSLSGTVARREGYFPPGVAVDVLELPSDLPGLGPGTYEHFFTASRLDGPKRLDLLIDAYRRVPGDVPLLIAGTGPEEDRLRERAGGDDRIRFLGFVSEEELAEHYRRALAVPFVPLDEDWGLIAVEAMSSATPVVTCIDSGGPADLVDDGVTGFVTEPTTASLAAALTRLVEDRGLAERLGTAGLARARAITWEGVVRRLTAGGERRVRRAAGALGRAAGGGSELPVPVRDGDRSWRRALPKVVVLSTFPIHPALHGGQVRSWHLYGNLAGRFDVELVCLDLIGGTTRTELLAPGVLQRVVARTKEHHEAENEWDQKVGIPVGDIVAGFLVERTPRFLAAAREALADAQLVLLAHPFLLEVAEQLAPDLPRAYDAHNCEADLKEDLLRGRPGADELLPRVVEIEGRAARTSRLVAACSTQDRERLAERYGIDAGSILLVPNGVDVAGIPFATGAARRRDRERFLATFGKVQSSGVTGIGVFLGSFHPPNVAAGKRLVELAPSIPEVLLVLAGGHVSALRRFGLPRNVAAAGIVSDTVKGALLRAATVGLNPVVHGSGTNLKLVEYLAAGLPVVSTPTGARGLPIEDGVHAVLAELADFPAAIREVAADPDRADALAAAGRALVEQGYDWAALGPALASALADTLV